MSWWPATPSSPKVAETVELFRRTDTDRRWLADACAQDPSRLLYVGHASAADGATGHADRAALHLAEGRPSTAGEMIAARLRILAASRAAGVRIRG